MAFNIRVWFVPFALHLGSSLSLLTIRGAARGEAPLRGGVSEQSERATRGEAGRSQGREP